MITEKTILTGAAVALAAYLFIKSEAKKAAETVTESLDPTSSNNIFASGVDKVGAVLTNDPNFRLGGWLYDKFNNKTGVQ